MFFGCVSIDNYVISNVGFFFYIQSYDIDCFYVVSFVEKKVFKCFIL